MTPTRAFRTLVSFAVVAAGVASTAVAAVRLTYPVYGTSRSIYWGPGSFPLKVEVDQRLNGGSADALGIIERAFGAWASLADADITFQETAFVAGDQAGRNGRNSITAADDLFKNQGILAITTNWYDDDGKMIEADIQIDSNLMTSNYNVQLALEHEIGHFLGLDHSPVLSAVMYPYVGAGTDAALDSDDRIAIAAVYPNSDPSMVGATLKGSVGGSSGGIFAAQVVALNERGEPVATVLTDQSGRFELRGVPAGDYRLYVEPLDGPVDPNNLAGIYRLAKVDSFPTEFMSDSPLHVDSGKMYGNLTVNSTGAPVRLNPKWIGLADQGQRIAAMNSMPATVRPGQTMAIAIGGDGFTSGMTTFEVMNPGVKRISEFRYAGNYAYADFEVSPQARAGSGVILVRSGNEAATLTGALRILEAPARTRAVRR